MQHSPLEPLTTGHMQMLQGMMYQAFCQHSMVARAHTQTHTHLTSSSNFRQSFLKKNLFLFVYYMNILKWKSKWSGRKSSHICIFLNLLSGSNQRPVHNWSVLDHSTKTIFFPFLIADGDQTWTTNMDLNHQYGHILTMHISNADGMEKDKWGHERVIILICPWTWKSRWEYHSQDDRRVWTSQICMPQSQSHLIM